MKVRINGALVVKKIDFRSLMPYSSDLSNRIGTASFDIIDDALSLGTTPTEGDLVEILSQDLTQLLCAGHLSQVTRTNTPVGRAYTCNVQDWNYLLDKIQCPLETFGGASGVTDAWLAGAIVAADGASAAFVAANSPYIKASYLNIPQLTFQPQTLRARLDALAKMVGGAPYWIDAARNFHWNDIGTIAPFAVSTNPGTNAYLEPIINFEDFRDSTQAVDQVTVTGAAAITSSQQNLPLHARLDQIRRYENASASLAGPVTTRFKTATVSDTTLDTAARVKQRAFAELLARSPRRTVRFSVWRDGLAAGQLIDVVNANWKNADRNPWPRPVYRWPTGSKSGALHDSIGRFLITKVTPKILKTATTDLLEYRVEAGAYEAGLQVLIAQRL